MVFRLEGGTLDSYLPPTICRRVTSQNKDISSVALQLIGCSVGMIEAFGSRGPTEPATVETGVLLSDHLQGAFLINSAELLSELMTALEEALQREESWVFSPPKMLQLDSFFLTEKHVFRPHIQFTHLTVFTE